MQDFNPDAGTVAIRKSKSGKAHHVVLTDQGADFFRQHCAGRPTSELMFRHGGAAWKKSEQARPMRAACAHARIKPAVGFHTLRHTWASLTTMAGVPLLVVAKIRSHGHADGGKALWPHGTELHRRGHPTRGTAFRQGHARPLPPADAGRGTPVMGKRLRGGT